MIMFFAACNSSNDNNAAATEMPVAHDSDTTGPKLGMTSKTDTSKNDSDITRAKPGLAYKIDTSKQVTKLLVPRDTMLTVKLQNNKGSVRCYLSGIGKHVTIIVPVQSGDSITAQLIPDDDTANIRFNQIFIPLGKSGKYDGPFSRKISYPIYKIHGNYRLIVGENLMAQADWKGNFTCNVLIK